MFKLTSDSNISERVHKKLDEGYEVRPFPTVVSRLLSAIKDPSADSGTFAEIVEMDMALSTRILKMVNSPIYGFNHKVRSVKQAITALGHQPLKNLALTFAGTSIIGGKGRTKSQHKALWNHSLGCATVAKIMTRSIHAICPDNAFLAGIFHDIGKIFYLDVIPDEYSPLVESKWDVELQSEELELLDSTHTEVGLKLAITWPLPDEIKGVIRYHHDPEEEPSENELTRLIHVADGIARYFGIGSPCHRDDRYLQRADDYFGIGDTVVDMMRGDAVRGFNETQRLFNRH